MDIKTWSIPRVNTEVSRDLLDLFLEVHPLLKKSLLGIVSVPLLDLELFLYLLDLVGELGLVGNQIIDLLQKALAFLVLATI